MTREQQPILQVLADLARTSTGARAVELVVLSEPEVLLAGSPAGRHFPDATWSRLETVSAPFVGPASDFFEDAVLDGSLVVVPITGPSAEGGWLAAQANEADFFDEASVATLADIAVLVEDRLDRSVEQTRLDELGETLQQNQEHLRAARNRLTISNQELEQFAYIAAHELVAPLRAVAVYAEVLGSVVPDDESEDSKRAQLCAAEIRAGVSLMDTQVQYLLELSQTQTGTVVAEPVHLKDVVEEALQTLHDELEDIEATVEVGELPVVTAKFVPMQSVFANLLSNAVRYRDAAQSLEIIISAEAVDDGWRVSVVDNGIGVDAADRARVFQLFERGSSAAGGSGIGLGLSRRILEAFGGSMGIDPTPDGSEFWFWLPDIDV